MEEVTVDTYLFWWFLFYAFFMSAMFWINNLFNFQRSLLYLKFELGEFEMVKIHAEAAYSITGKRVEQDAIVDKHTAILYLMRVINDLSMENRKLKLRRFPPVSQQNP